MCTTLKIRIRNSHDLGPKNVWVPCGQCEECRNALRSAWSFRFRCEFDSLLKQGWHVAFYTLTYNNRHLPHIPKELEKNENEFNCPPCFSRQDCKNFVTAIRHRLYNQYSVGKKNKETGEYIVPPLRWGIFCEYGEDTKRPHYHGLFCYPPCVPDSVMFGFLDEFWKDEKGDSLGFHIPKDIQGGYDSDGYYHKPFVCADSVAAAGAASYAAKYCCKDLSFFESFDRNDFRFSNGDLKIKDFLPFHMQSRSMGAFILDGLTDSQKMDLLKTGKFFVGTAHAASIPLFIRNKILYDNKYLFDIKTHKRLCRRQASEFLERHYEEIFKQRCDFITDKIEYMTSRQTWVNDLETYEQIKVIRQQINEIGLFNFSEYIAAYYGVSMLYVNFYDYPALFWKKRFDLSLSRSRSYNQFPDEVLYKYGLLMYLYDTLNLLYSDLHHYEQSIIQQKQRFAQKVRERINYGGML